MGYNAESLIRMFQLAAENWWTFGPLILKNKRQQYPAIINEVKTWP